MKYENLKEAINLCNEITAATNSLNALSGDCVAIKITSYQVTLTTIGTWPSCEHEFKSQAALFVEMLATELRIKINALHDKLTEL